jgi:glycosyl transferase family 25
MGVNRRVDAVYVLSVRTFADRIAHIEAEMARHGVAFEFVFDYDANAIPPELIDRMFAPSDLRLAHQSLVLKHVRTWQLAVERNLGRVLVFEDDAVLEDRFETVVGAALDEAERLAPGWTIYLGRGNNQVLPGARGAPMLRPGAALPATDALLFDREAAQRRLAFLASHRITRPADWLIRETDAATGVAHYWLRDPVVQQGSMNGRFASVLDGKRRVRGRWYAWLRFRWDRAWRGLRYRGSEGRRDGRG